jgi:Predicted membrane protein (DUF2339)
MRVVLLIRCGVHDITMAHMTDAQQAALMRLSEEFTVMSHQMARVAGQLSELERTLRTSTGPAAAMVPVFAPPTAPPMPPPPYYAYPPAAMHPMPHPMPQHPMPPPGPPIAKTRRAGEPGWIGKLLAVAGVAVTLIGVVLLLVLAAQAGILRPEIRVGAGVLLAAGLVATAVTLNGRPGGRVGAIALAATGVAAAYIDVIGVTTIYHWATPPVGLLIAAVIGGAGLALARRWDSQQLGLLVFLPLMFLAPIVTDGVTLLLVGFMLVLSAAALPVQLGRDWTGMYAARTAAVSAPLLIALVAASFGTGDDPWLLGGACGVAALLAVVGAVVLLPATGNRIALALLTVIGVLPALSAAIAVNRLLSALLAAAVSLTMLAIVLNAQRLPGVPGVVRNIWAALSAVAALIMVTVAFDGYVGGPVLLALAVVVAVAGRRDIVARWAATGFAAAGGAVMFGYAPPTALMRPTELPIGAAVSALAAALLLAVASIAIGRSWIGTQTLRADRPRALWAVVVPVTAYCVTTFTVTAGVLIGGPDGGFLAGHMAATICWIGMAAGLFVCALRIVDREARTGLIAGGLALTAAATAKLFLFDLGTLDGMFRVAVFIVVGLVLLGMGAGYARSLVRHDGGKQSTGPAQPS